MSSKREERAAPPPGDGEWDVRFADNAAAKGWDDLCSQAPANTHKAWVLMRSDPTPTCESSRHHRLKYKLASRSYKGAIMDHWQIEVTGGGRIWYLVDERRRTVWIDYAGTGHPKRTD